MLLLRMSDEETNTLHAAIVTMYSESGAGSVQAGIWLTDFQKTMSAWTACDRLLSERRDSVSVWFAAQTLRQKILKNLNELPKESLPSLRESLTNHLSNVNLHAFDHMADVTATQLCLAIADLYIQVHEWNNWLSELLNKFTSMDGDRTRMLLVLLRVFPEEVDTIAVGENRRRAVREEIASSAHSVLQFLNHVLEQRANQSDEDFVRKVVSCLAAYLTNPSVPTDELAQSSLLQAVFVMLHTKQISSNLHEDATECIVNALFRAEDSLKHRPLAIALHRGVVGLRQPFMDAIQLEDMDRLTNFGRIFVEHAESMLEFIVNGAGEAEGEEGELGSFEGLELLVLLADHHDSSLIEMTFHIWYRISEALFQIDQDEHVFKFAPHVSRYLRCLYKHVRYETDMEGLPLPGSEFLDLREKAAESVKDVVYIVGTENLIKMMFETMVQCASSNGTWDETEAALFITSQIIHNLLPDELSVVPDLLGAICGQPSTTHPALVLTCIQLLGGAAEWLQKHSEYQEGCLKWLGELIVNPLFSYAAGEAIASICGKCGAALASSEFVTRLIGLIPVLETTLSNAKAVEGGITYILRATTQVVMFLPDNEKIVRLNEIGEVIYIQFEQALQTTISSASAQTSNNNNNNENERDAWRVLAKEPLVWIDRISAVFREVAPWISHANGDLPAPWLQLAHNLWKPLSHSLRLFSDNGRIVEHICRAIRFLVRSLGVQSQGFVEPLVTQMMEVYQKHPHSCILYLASILVDEYGAQEHIRQGLLTMLQTLGTRSFESLNKMYGLQNNPDTVDDLFRLASRFVLRCPSPFFCHPMAAALFECAIAAFGVEHQDANRSVTRFVIESFSQLLNARGANYRDDGVAALEAIVLEKGARITQSALAAGMFELNSHLKRDQADILHLLAKIDKQHFSSWLQQSLSLPRYSTTPCATREQIVAFHDNMLKESDSRSIYAHMRDFARLFV